MSDPNVPLMRAAEDAADAALEAEFARLNPELQRRFAMKVLEVDALRRRVVELEDKLEWVKHALPVPVSDELTEWLDTSADKPLAPAAATTPTQSGGVPEGNDGAAGAKGPLCIRCWNELDNGIAVDAPADSQEDKT